MNRNDAGFHKRRKGVKGRRESLHNQNHQLVVPQVGRNEENKKGDRILSLLLLFLLLFYSKMDYMLNKPPASCRQEIHRIVYMNGVNLYWSSMH